ncbi:MAG: sel1 repeat family protein [Gammaproteobacteria bacterium]|jgi:TPR repeat protein|nr:sel1 repeat family protein [Gammaproteobacteria bacterium]
MNTKDQLKKLAQEGDEEAQYALGRLYEFAASASQAQKDFNKRRAMPYYQAAAEKGHPEAALRYALGCERGYTGIAQPEEAFKYYKKAAVLSNIRAHYELARCFENGIGTTKSIGRAMENYGRTVRLIRTLIADIQCGRIPLTAAYTPDLNEANWILKKAEERIKDIGQAPTLGTPPPKLG